MRLGAGIQWDLSPRWGIQATGDIKYASKLNDQSGLGTIGFERVNDTGNRLTIPFMAGVYVKF